MLGTLSPAAAQLRADLPLEETPAKLYDQGGSSFSLNKLFSPEHFQMRQSFEVSAGSWGGQGSSMAMYTNTMMWQFNQKLAARVDVSYATAPFGGEQLGFGEGNQGRVFLRNAEVAYRPTENMQIHFSVRQSPFGRYASPYGYHSPFGAFGHQAFAPERYDLFWNSRQR